MHHGSGPVICLDEPSPFPRRWAIACCALLALVYLLGLSEHWMIGSDSGLYLTLARNLAQGEGYSIAGQPHTLVPPGAPLLLAGLMSLGLTSFLALNAAMMLLGLGTIALVYLLIRVLQPGWALVIALIVGLSNEMTQRSGELLSDVPFMLLVYGGLWMYYRGLRARPSRRLWEVGSVLLVTACLVRVPGFLLAPAAAIGLVISASREARPRALLNLVLVVLLCASFVGFFAWYKSSHAAEQASYLSSISYTVSGKDAAALFAQVGIYAVSSLRDLSRVFLAQRMPVVLSILLLAVPVLVAAGTRLARRDAVGPLVVLLYSSMMFVTKVRTRYWLVLLPLLVLYMIEGYSLILRRIANRLPVLARPRTQVRVLSGILTVILLMNLPLVARTIWQKHQPEYAVAQQDGDWADELAAADYLRQYRPGGGVILASHPVGYLSGIHTIVVPREVNLGGMGSPDDLRRMLQQRDVRYIVMHFSEDENLSRFEQQLLETLADVEPAMDLPRVRIYRVSDLADSVAPEHSSATSSPGGNRLSTSVSDQRTTMPAGHATLPAMVER